MLLMVDSMNGLDFDSLMRVYISSNHKAGANKWRWASEERQLEFAERAFYDYLHDVFFQTPGAFYAVWAENGRYASALRMEPYEDGLLLEGLETAPDLRERGFASRLLRDVLQQSCSRVYSHVEKRNAVSLAVHCSCGFSFYRDNAVLVDGTISNQVCTLVWNCPKK